MLKSKLLIQMIIFLISLSSFGQTQLNQIDANGWKQGYWKMYDDMGFLKYEGSFKNDIACGLFKY